MAVDLIIVHLNRASACSATVRQFLDQANRAEIALSVAVVDNGSSKTELGELHRDLPQGTSIIETGSNLGFGPGANVGLRQWLDSSSSEICLLAPHDARPAPMTIDLLLREFLAHPEAGLASADVGDGNTPRIQPWLGPIGEPQASGCGWEEADYPHGTLMVLRRNCVEDVGIFDERFFSYCEEADLGIRARSAGWKIGLVRGALVTNPESNSESGLIDYLMVRNTLLLLRKHFGLANMVFRIGVVIAEHILGWWRPSIRSPYHTGSARFRAITDALLNRYGSPF